MSTGDELVEPSEEPYGSKVFFFQYFNDFKLTFDF